MQKKVLIFANIAHWCTEMIDEVKLKKSIH